MALDIEARWRLPADEAAEPDAAFESRWKWLQTAAITFIAASGVLIAASLSVLMHLA